MSKRISKDGLNAPPLTDKCKPWGVIQFVHSDGKVHKFYTAVNELSGSRLTAFDNDPPGVDDPLPWIKSVFRDIRSKARVLGYAGTKHFE